MVVFRSLFIISLSFCGHTSAVDAVACFTHSSIVVGAACCFGKKLDVPARGLCTTVSLPHTRLVCAAHGMRTLSANLTGARHSTADFTNLNNQKFQIFTDS